jgi:PmbA protein
MRDIAQFALEALTKGGADKASVSAKQGRKDEFNIEAGKFSLMRTLFNDSITLKALVGGRKGVISINKTDRDSITEAVQNCITLAKTATPDEAEDIAPVEQNQHFDQRVGGADMAKLFSRTKEYLEQVGDEFPKIVLEGVTSYFEGDEHAYVNSNGVEFTGANEWYMFQSMFVAKDGDNSSSFNYGGGVLKTLDAPFMDFGLLRQMHGESVKSLNTRMVEGKFTGPIIVAPTCEDMIWHNVLDNFLGDRCMIEATSRWKDALGTKVADSKLTLRKVPLSQYIACGERFTPDGFVSRDEELIRDGVLKAFSLGLYGANKTGKPRAQNTANYNLEVLPGDVALADMIKGIDRGILLGRFSGGSPGASGDVSGVAKNSFMIENGQITDALQETMVSFNVLDALMNLTAISKERVMDGYQVLPWCRFDGVTVSGK